MGSGKAVGDAVGDDLSPGLGHVVLPPRRRLLREQERPGRPRLHLALLREEEEGAGTRTSQDAGVAKQGCPPSLQRHRLRTGLNFPEPKAIVRLYRLSTDTLKYLLVCIRVLTYLHYRRPTY